MPWENPWVLFILLYCFVPLAALGILCWASVNIYRAIFGVPKQAIRSVERVAIAQTVAGTILEAERLKNPAAHERVTRTRVWSAYSIVALFLLVGLTVAGYAAGVVPGLLLTVVDVAYGFHLMDKAREGKNPRRIQQRDAKRLVASRAMKTMKKK